MLSEMKSADTPMPAKPARVPMEELLVKEAVGIALWNSRFGSEGRLYLAKTVHPEIKTPLARFFGGTAVPTSAVSSWNQSLIWIQDYLGESIFQEAIAGFLVLHRAYYFDQPMFQNALDAQESSRSSVPGHEIHGILPCSENWLSRHADRMVEVRKDAQDEIHMTPDLPLNNVVLAQITNHLLCFLNDQTMGCKVEVHASSTRGRIPARINEVAPG